tara:strand:- start:5061 stop:5315 length:255 start_codon:yes stop_codon:yes gene_type:complete
MGVIKKYERDDVPEVIDFYRFMVDEYNSFGNRELKPNSLDSMLSQYGEIILYRWKNKDNFEFTEEMKNNSLRYELFKWDILNKK